MNPIYDLMTLPCVVRRVVVGEPDAAGDSASTTTETDYLCDLQQSSSVETRDGGQVVVTTWNLYGFVDPVTRAPVPDAPLDADDVVLVGGTTYAVDGKPWHARDPLSGEGSHVEAKLRVVG